MNDNGRPSYLTSLQNYVDGDEKTVVGMHSGTSADGPTVLVARVSGAGETARIRVVDHETYSYPRELRDTLLRVTERSTSTIDQICQADMAVGAFFAAAALDMMRRIGIGPDEVALVASSGQVTYQVIPGQREDHHWYAGTELVSMLDLGEGAVIANQTGVLTISGLRRKDNAVGGFGAPLVPFGDWVNFRHESIARVVWNLGGICNATVIPAGEPFEAVWAFDAGPCNMLLDQLADMLTSGSATFDEDGRIAERGVVSEALIEVTMQDAFVQRDLPKAAARQLYGEEFARNFIDRSTALGLSGDDMMATATALTAEVIADAQRRFITSTTPVRELIFAGGGTRNPVLMRMIAERVAPATVVTSDKFGIPVDCREVMAMVMIANETLHGRPSNCLPATGGKQSVSQGHIDLPM